MILATLFTVKLCDTCANRPPSTRTDTLPSLLPSLFTVSTFYTIVSWPYFLLLLAVPVLKRIAVFFILLSRLVHITFLYGLSFKVRIFRRLSVDLCWHFNRIPFRPAGHPMRTDENVFYVLFFFPTQMAVTAHSKIVKKGGSDPDQFELSIAQALLELQNNSDLKAQLRELYITKAKEIELFGKKVSVVWVLGRYLPKNSTWAKKEKLHKLLELGLRN